MNGLATSGKRVKSSKDLGALFESLKDQKGVYFGSDRKDFKRGKKTIHILTFNPNFRDEAQVHQALNLE